MRRLLLGTVATALVLVLAGCGDSDSDTASDPTGQSSTSTTPSADPQTIAIVSETAAGGQVDLNAVPVDDEEARAEFAAQFERGGLEAKIADAIAGATVPEGYTVVAAVVAIGCDVPPGVTVTQQGDGWVLTPQEVPSPLQECFAPVTSVAVVAVPA
jgi:hypothetical protein